MKKIIYSSITKGIAVILFIAFIVFGVLTASGGIVDYCNEEEDIYSFETDFSESWFVSSLLNETENVVFNAFRNAFQGDVGSINSTDKNERIKNNLNKLDG